MALAVYDVADEDILRACEIEFAAYKGSPLAPVLAPGPFPPDAAQERAKELIEQRRNDSTIHYVQCRDETTGKLVAFSKYIVVQHPEDTAPPAPPASQPRVMPGRNVEASLMYSEGLAQRKKEIVGSRPHICRFANRFFVCPHLPHTKLTLDLHLLHTDPALQGRGAGGLLLDRIIKRADELGLPIYLESSAAGHRFYQHRGLKDVELFKVDFRPYGGPVHEQPLMLREPLT